MITGPCEPGRCGVGDYTVCLANALKSAGVDARMVTAGDWGLFDTLSGRARPAKPDFDILHLQYPTAGFGTKLGPQLFSLMHRCVVTIHEASQRHVLRKVSLLPFTARPRHLIFTSMQERDFVSRWAPWIGQNFSIIPVGSAIPRATRCGTRNPNQIVHFGLIMPGKGLEDVLELSRLIRTFDLPLVVKIIGHVDHKHLAYFENLRFRSANLPVIWHNDLADDQVAEQLAKCSIAYFPFPDGASDRRTSLKAAFNNGLAVITTEGSHTPSDLKDVVALAANPRQALEQVRSLLEDRGRVWTMSLRATEYAGRYKWDSIAKMHTDVYHSLLGTRSVESMGKTPVLS